MSPLECRRLVGQPDIVERLRGSAETADFLGPQYGKWSAFLRDSADTIERLRSQIPALTDHAAIDALAERAGVHRGAVFAVIKAMQEGE